MTIASDCHEIVEAIAKLDLWPRYRALLEQIFALKGSFTSISFEAEKLTANSTVADAGYFFTRVNLITTTIYKGQYVSSLTFHQILEGKIQVNFFFIWVI